ncbi:helix-turn-helix domain-containing protein [Arthrobacter sp. 31Y]|uniref:helix-turn-helix domain-containing protein n=1 Tax=Arthrobacter sp. 31Y TaxID=1115632 RepID=UPI000462E951|nr:helix-turn-helix domain-containing protein [Arthrobacter sp. 31Y]
MPTLTVAATSTTTETLTALDSFAGTLPEGEAREAIEAVVGTLRSGRDVIIAGADDALTPNQAAKILGVSRAHLYKVLDSGAMPYTTVGARDRRIAMADLRDYITKAEELRRVSARNAAHARTTRSLAIDEM